MYPKYLCLILGIIITIICTVISLISYIEYHDGIVGSVFLFGGIIIVIIAGFFECYAQDRNLIADNSKIAGSAGAISV